MNQHTLDMIKPKEKKIFEAHGETDNFLYFDMKMCSGDVKVKFLQGDGQDIDKDESKAQTIKDNNTFLHYLKIQKKNIFIEIENSDEKLPAYFDLMTYLEKKVSNDPSSEVVQENEGKVLVETDSSKVVFDSLKVTTNYEDLFLHKITYTVYLTSSLSVMRYVKNCGEFLVDQNFPNDEIFVNSLSFDLSLNQLQNHFGKLSIPLKKLKPNTKYYGVLVADVAIFPRDIGQLTPLRSNKVFYDEFIFVSAKYDIPFIYMI